MCALSIIKELMVYLGHFSALSESREMEKVEIKLTQRARDLLGRLHCGQFIVHCHSSQVGGFGLKF